MFNSTINRKTPKNRLENDILYIIRKSKNPVSTAEIASKLKKPWHSVQTRCLRLQLEGKINGFRVGRMNLWVFKR